MIEAILLVCFAVMTSFRLCFNQKDKKAGMAYARACFVIGILICIF